MSRLSIYQEEELIQEVVLMRAVVTVGRHPENDVVLDDPTLSRHHARIERRGDRYVIVESGAANGVFVNGVRVVRESDLHPGDEIGLGVFIAVFDAASGSGHPPGPAETPSPPPRVGVGDAEADDTGALHTDGFSIDIESIDIESLVAASIHSEFDEYSGALASRGRAGLAEAEPDDAPDESPRTQLLAALPGSADDDSALAPTPPPAKRATDRSPALVDEHPEVQVTARGETASHPGATHDTIASLSLSDDAPEPGEPDDRDMAGGATRERVPDLGEADGGFESETTAIDTRSRFQPLFVLFHAGVEISRHKVGTRAMTIGRAQGSDIVIGLLGLSRRHARIHRRGTEVVLEDLGSQNGTWVNNARVQGEHRLQHGDILNFYEYALLYLAHPEEPSHVASELASAPPSATPSPPAPDLDAVATAPKFRPDVADSDAGVPSEPSSTFASIQSQEEPAFDFGSVALGEGVVFGDEFEAAELPLEGRAATSGATQIGEPEFNTGFLRELEADESFFGATDGFEHGATVDKTTAQQRPLELSEPPPEAAFSEGAPLWPSDAELETALRHPLRERSAGVEVYLDEQFYTQVPLRQPITRVGVDPRCELALPIDVELSPWHLTLLYFGTATLAIRATQRSLVTLNERDMHQAVLRDRDELVLGRVRMIYRYR